MKKKVLSALLVAAMSVSVLAGCGSKADNNTDAKNDASQENTLSVWCWDPNFNVYAMKQAEAIYRKITRISNWIFRKKYIQILRQL